MEVHPTPQPPHNTNKCMITL